MEVTPSLSEPLGTPTKSRKWNNEFTEGKMGSFRFVGKEEMLNEIKSGASSGPSKGEKLPP